MAANKVVFEIDALDKGAVAGFANLTRSQKELQSETRKENILLEKQVEQLKKAAKESKVNSKPNKPAPPAPAGNPLKVMGGGWSSAEGIMGAGLGAMGIGSIIDPLVRGLEAWEAAVTAARERQQAIAKEQIDLAKATGPGMLYMSPEEREQYTDSRDEISKETGKSLTFFDPLREAFMPFVKSMDDLESAMRAVAIASVAGVASDADLIAFETRAIESGMSPGVGTSVLYEASQRSGDAGEFQSLIPIMAEMKDFPNAIALALTAVKNTEDGKAGEMLSAMASLQDKNELGDLKEKMGLHKDAEGEGVVKTIEGFINNTANVHGTSRENVVSELVKQNLLSQSQGEAVNVLSKQDDEIDQAFVTRNIKGSSEASINNLVTALDELRKSLPAFDQSIKNDIQKAERDVSIISDMTPEQAKVQEDERMFADRLTAAGMEELINPATGMFDDSKASRWGTENTLKKEERLLQSSGVEDTIYSKDSAGLGIGLSDLFKLFKGVDTSNKDPKRMEELLAQIAANTAKNNSPAAPPNRNSGR